MEPPPEGQPHLGKRESQSPPPSRASIVDADANNLATSLKHLSLDVAVRTPLPHSPDNQSPRLHQGRLPASPGFPPSPFRRSSSVLSNSRSSSPALVKKSSSASLRLDLRGASARPPSRRSSLNPTPSTSATMSDYALMNASTVAERWFENELDACHGRDSTAQANTLVILNADCYGHKFSRAIQTKDQIEGIMERPERLTAIIRGVAAAYVDFGGRHDGGSHAPHPNPKAPESIPFKILKSTRSIRLNSKIVTEVHPELALELDQMCTKVPEKLESGQLEVTRERLPNGKLKPINASQAAGPVPPTKQKRASGDLHSADRKLEEFHALDLYLGRQSRNAIEGAIGAVCDGVDAVFQGTASGNGPSKAFVSVRPPGHHCSHDWPSGFCYINNVHVGIEHAMSQHGLTAAAIIDFDLHHGDGSQAIAIKRNREACSNADSELEVNRPKIGYFSIHDVNSFPCEFGDLNKIQAAGTCIDTLAGQAVWNVHLEHWETPEEFWKLYEDKYLVLLDKARRFLRHHAQGLDFPERKGKARLPAKYDPSKFVPKTAIFISAGFDASEHEYKNMSRHARSVPTEFYDRFTRDIVRLAEEDGTAAEGRVISVLEGGYSDHALSTGVHSHLSGLCGQQSWKNEWCSQGRLLQLEALTKPAPPAPVVPPPPKVRSPKSFSAHTQTSAAKVRDQSKVQRIVSGDHAPRVIPLVSPPPKVDWAASTRALIKILIPSDKETRSFTLEELKKPKVRRIKQQVEPASEPSIPAPTTRNLRSRKSVAAPQASALAQPKVRPKSRAKRRETIADPTSVRAISPPPLPQMPETGLLQISRRTPSPVVQSKSSPPRPPASPGAVGDGPSPRSGASSPLKRRSPSPDDEGSPKRIGSGQHTGQIGGEGTQEQESLDNISTSLSKLRLTWAGRAEEEAREKELAARRVPAGPANVPTKLPIWSATGAIPFASQQKAAGWEAEQPINKL